MQRLSASEIKKILFGILLSDGNIRPDSYRFDLYNKNEDYIRYVQSVLNQVSGVYSTFSVKEDKRGYTGYRVWTKGHAYFKNLYDLFYDGRKVLNEYVCSRLDAQALAHVWMCDGYLEHAKNRKTNKVQNVGWFCLESFPKEELQLFQNRLLELGVESSLVAKPWGFGYRIRIGGENLQRFVSIIYPYILDCFRYKTVLFYKDKQSANLSLPSAEQYIVTYTSIEDIVRYFQ